MVDSKGRKERKRRERDAPGPGTPTKDFLSKGNKKYIYIKY